MHSQGRFKGLECDTQRLKKSLNFIQREILQARYIAKGVSR